MTSLVMMFEQIMHDERGHAPPAIAALAGGIGAVVLGIGAASDSDAASIIGGIALAIGVFGGSVAHHLNVDYDVFRRLENLEK